MLAAAYEPLFAPLVLPNGAVLPNRIAKAAMEENLADPGQLPGPALWTLYRRWAQGGVGLQITGNVMVDPSAVTGPGGVVLDARAPLAPFETWAKEAKSGGGQVWMQINHPGRQTYADLGQGAVAPSAVPVDLGKLSNLLAQPRALTADEIVGKVALQALAGAIGALLAQNQFGQSVNDAEPPGQRVKGYFAELFIMAVGATFLAFNVAPTEEMIVISFQMTVWQTLALVLLSLLMMHGFVYALRFQGQEEHRPEDAPGWSLFLRYTIAGYAVCLVMSLYVLWSFGRLDGMGVQSAVMAAMVLCFPASVGAAAARLIL